jgi:alpha-L-fucosidase 2
LVYARLLQSESAYQRLAEVIAGRTSGNLWMTHPPFQIDANFGFAASVNEMLLASHLGEIHLLPSLPKAWADGKVTGLRVRGGFEADIEWKEGKLVKATIRNVSSTTGECTVRYGDSTTKLKIPAGGSQSYPKK